MWVKVREREKNKEKHVNRAMFLTACDSHEEHIGETEESKPEAEPKEFEIDSGLHENYIKMIQKGISNEESLGTKPPVLSQYMLSTW
jgi:hypothetical protein